MVSSSFRVRECLIPSSDFSALPEPLTREDPLFQKGHTLLEIVMVLVISGFLIAIIAPKFLQQTTSAKVTKTKAGLEKLRAAIALYYAKEGRYPAGGDLSQILAPYIKEIPADGFTNKNTVTYSMGMSPCPLSQGYGGWCYLGDGYGGGISPNLPNNDTNYGYEDFSTY